MARVTRMQLALLLGGLLAAFGAFGHGQPLPTAHAQVQTDTFVGRLDGIDAFIGIGSDGNAVRAYVCDGANNALGDNFRGTIDQASDGALTLQAANGDVLYLYMDSTTIDSQLVPDGNITGILRTTDGTDHSFNTEAAVSPGGLFLADPQGMPDGSTADGGWVVLNDGEVRGSFSREGTDFGHGGFLGQPVFFAPAVIPQLALAQVQMFGVNLNQVFLRGGGTLGLPIMAPFTQTFVFAVVVIRFTGRR